MKNILIFFALLFINSYSADYCPLEVNNIWKYASPSGDTITIKITGDTTIQPTKYYSVEQRGINATLNYFIYSKNDFVYQINSLTIKDDTTSIWGKHKYEDGETFYANIRGRGKVSFVGQYSTYYKSFDSCFLEFYEETELSGYFAPNVGYVESLQNDEIINTIIDYELSVPSKIIFSNKSSFCTPIQIGIKNNHLQFFNINKNIESVVIYSLSGKLIQRLNIDNRQNQFIFNENLPNGNYIYHILGTNANSLMRYCKLK